MVDVIDVREQNEIQLTLKELVDHFNARPRSRLLNMLSLEFSQTRLSELVQPPHVVSELSLITNCWVPDGFDEESDDPSDASSSIPSVQKYCLLSMRGSYTDFHVDFGGSSVWYHVLWGEKIFYLLPPTPENCTAYWNCIFFPDMLEEAWKSDHNRSADRPQVFQLRQSRTLHIRHQDVLKELLTLKPNKSHGPDRLEAAILKECAHTLSPVFTALFNQCLENGIIPDCWKAASINPVPKRGTSKFRAIACTSVVLKLFEKLLLQVMSSQLNV
ncbi:unnamed protein product [Echinostoma caproni]|uniref:JmjC domain-containing protein n=1 Tax=Echinostoma caproni TaxID=27848 RepID=A0A183BFR1_9TREM|nr:unnamed protein product [Echinostoma caproni]